MAFHISFALSPALATPLFLFVSLVDVQHEVGIPYKIQIHERQMGLRYEISVTAFQ